MKKIIFPLIALLFFMSCGNSKKISSVKAHLFQRWDLKALNGNDISGTYMKPVYIEFNAAESRVSGSAACNRFFGSFSQAGASLRFGPLASTKMLCDETSNKLEVEFLQALEKVISYKIENNSLFLLHDNNVIARFEESKSVPDELVGKWELFYITGRRIAFPGLYPERKPFILFQQGTNTFSANTSCNETTGTYNGQKGEKLFNPGATTLKICPGEGEMVFTQQLKNIDKYQIKGDTLTLYSNDIPSMRFIKSIQ